MQLRYLEEIKLHKTTKVKQSNGTYTYPYTLIKIYKVQFQELLDEVSASVYGATVNKMYRISSPRRVLECLLKEKLNNSSDNISKYFIEYKGSLYKIVAVKKNWIDIEFKEIIVK